MVEFKQIIGRGTRTYEPMDKSKEKLGFYILEYANYSTQLFNDPEWDDEPENFIDEGVIVVDESADISTQEGESTDDVPVTPEEQERKNIDSKGVYVEEDEDKKKEIQYRMSEEFLAGRVGIVAETETLTIGGKPVDADDYILYASESFLSHVPDMKTLSNIWKDVSKRNQFSEETIKELDFSLEALKSIFFQKHGVRDVDLFDVFSNLIFKQKIIRKEQRIEKAKQLHSKFFNETSQRNKQLVIDILDVYGAEDFSSLAFTQEFFQIPQMLKYGGLSGIQKLFGGKDETKNFVIGLHSAIYDERISA
jgi:type I restriction enzyme R subunit